MAGSDNQSCIKNQTFVQENSQLALNKKIRDNHQSSSHNESECKRTIRIQETTTDGVHDDVEFAGDKSKTSIRPLSAFFPLQESELGFDDSPAPSSKWWTLLPTARIIIIFLNKSCSCSKRPLKHLPGDIRCNLLGRVLSRKAASTVMPFSLRNNGSLYACSTPSRASRLPAAPREQHGDRQCPSR